MKFEKTSEKGEQNRETSRKGTERKKEKEGQTLEPNN